MSEPYCLELDWNIQVERGMISHPSGPSQLQSGSREVAIE